MIKLTTMKRVFLSVIFIFAGVLCFAQNGEIDIKHIHSDEGKQWKRYIRPDADPVALSLEDDVFTFFTNGNFKYDQSGTVTQALNLARTKTWSFNKETSILSWEFY